MVNFINSHKQKTNFAFTKIFIKFGTLGTMPTFTFNNILKGYLLSQANKF